MPQGKDQIAPDVLEPALGDPYSRRVQVIDQRAAIRGMSLDCRRGLAHQAGEHSERGTDVPPAHDRQGSIGLDHFQHIREAGDSTIDELTPEICSISHRDLILVDRSALVKT